MAHSRPILPNRTGSIADEITEIARRTSLLAINARIQAALAGEAGSGFAVVATEVKELSTKTRSAVDGIASQIEQVTAVANRSGEFLQRVLSRIESLESAASGICNSAGAQCASTSDIAERMTEISASTQSVAENIDAAQGTARDVERLHQLEQDVFGAAPEHLDTEFPQVFLAVHDGEEMIARELAHLARKTTAAVRNQDFGFAVPARIEQNVADRGMTGVIFEPRFQVEIAQRDPAGLAAPAHVNDLLAIGQKRRERRDRSRRSGIGERDEMEISGDDADGTHGLMRIYDLGETKECVRGCVQP
jgi:Methyl-accepting chemotaxis protein (MCP) signalling domain